MDAPLILEAALFALTPFLFVLVVAFFFRIFAKEDLPMWMGVFIGLAFVGASLDDVGEAASVLGISKFLLVMVLAAWAARFGNQLGSKLPTYQLREGGHMLKKSLSKVSGKPFFDALLPPYTSIEDIHGKKPVSEEVKKALGGRRFVLPADLPIEVLEARIRHRLINDWRVGDAEVKMDESGRVVKLALSAKKTRLSNIIPRGKALFSFKPESLPFELGYGDHIDIYLKGMSIKDVEVLSVTADTVSVVIGPRQAEKLAKRIAQGASPSIVVFPKNYKKKAKKKS